MRLLLAFLLLLPLRLLAAVGDITGAEVETNGWVIKLYISGLNTNGNFFSGFDTNDAFGFVTGTYTEVSQYRSTSTNRLTLTAQSMGYDDDGNGIVVTRTLYGTKIARCPYPSTTTNQIIPDVDGCIAKVLLSDYVFQSDSNLTLTALSGAYATTNAATNCNAIAGLAVTNGSLLSYSLAKVIANSSYPCWQRWTNPDVTVRAVAFQAYAEQGRPVRSARAVATDTNGVSVTNFQTQMVIDRSMPDAIPTAEYVFPLNLTVLSNGPIRIDYTFYPWVGDTNAVADTFNNATNQPTPLFCAQTNFYDTARPTTWAIVATNGVSGGVVSSSAFTGTEWVTPFDTVGHAYDACVLSNAAWYGNASSNGGNVIIYVTLGSNRVFGSSTTKGNKPYSFCSVTRYPSNTIGQVVFDHADSYTDARCLFWHYYDVTFAVSTSLKNAFQYPWIDRCIVDTTGNFLSTATIHSNVWVTDCIMTNLGDVCLANGCNLNLYRGNTIWDTTVGVLKGGCHVLMGNDYKSVQASANTFALTEDSTSASTKPMSKPIVYNNRFAGGRISASSLFEMNNFRDGSDGVLVQNVMENVATNAGTQLLGISGLCTNFTNILFWNNTLLGQRTTLAYCDTTNMIGHKMGIVLVNNAINALHVKTDTFGGSASPLTTGNWSAVNGVGWCGNLELHILTIAPETGPQEFPGFSGVSVLSSNYANWFGWVANGAFDGTNVPTGLGNYRMRSDAPTFWNTRSRWLLPYDIEGVPRGLIDPPGAYSSGNVRKGGMF